MMDLEGYNGFKITSPKMLEVFEAVRDFARHGQPLIMFGPSGAGKEFLARYYFTQYRKVKECRGKFLSINCSQLVRGTAHSTLFGHVKGAFTDAYQDQLGQFELAKQGVLFLDEIGDLDEELQTMLNRALDENTRIANKLGSTKTYSTEDVLVICATERPKDRINDGLLFRAGLQIHVPGLDDRPEDIEEAVTYFCRKAFLKRFDWKHLFSLLLDRNEDKISTKTLDDPDIVKLVHTIATKLSSAVEERDWPGNFRALRQAVDSGIIRAKNLNSPDDFLKDVIKYFRHHLGDYSISVLDDLEAIQTETTSVISTTVGKWMTVLNREVPNLDHKEKTRLCAFLSEYANFPFKRSDFEKEMLLKARNAQIRISMLIKKGILEKVEGKGYLYQVSKDLLEADGPDSHIPQLMELPEAGDKDFMPEKTLEALGIIENSRGLFISNDDPQKRETFLGSLAASLKEKHDIIYFSFHKNDLKDFISGCIEHLSDLNMKGWFLNTDELKAKNKLELREKIIGLSGYFTQALSQHRKTIIILEGIEVFSTGESQALIEQMIYFWYPVQFVLGSKKQFFQQGLSSSVDFMELNL